MGKIRVVLLGVTMLSSIFVATDIATADPVSLFCVTARLGTGLGAAKVDFVLAIDEVGPFRELAGEARFSAPVAPPGNLIIYAISGTAIPNADGFWVSLSGTGYDVAKTVFRGTFTAQLSVDPSKNTFSYTRQNLDGSGASTSTSTLPITLCTP
jgi:hypothetical protein